VAYLLFCCYLPVSLSMVKLSLGGMMS